MVPGRGFRTFDTNPPKIEVGAWSLGLHSLYRQYQVDTFPLDDLERNAIREALRELPAVWDFVCILIKPGAFWGLRDDENASPISSGLRS